MKSLVVKYSFMIYVLVGMSVFGDPLDEVIHAFRNLPSSTVVEIRQRVSENSDAAMEIVLEYLPSGLMETADAYGKQCAEELETLQAAGRPIPLELSQKNLSVLVKTLIFTYAFMDASNENGRLLCTPMAMAWGEMLWDETKPFGISGRRYSRLKSSLNNDRQPIDSYVLLVAALQNADYEFAAKLRQEVLSDPLLSESLRCYYRFWVKGLSEREGAGFDADEMLEADCIREAIIPLRYSEVTPFSDGLAAVKKDGEWSYIDPTGYAVLKGPWKSAQAFSEGYAGVEDDDGWQFIDVNGVPLGTRRWEDVLPFSEGLAAVKSGGQWGYIDPAGTLVIEPQWNRAESFSEGAAVVLVQGKTKPGTFLLSGDIVTEEFRYAYIDRSGRRLFAEKSWEKAMRFSEGLAAVRLEVDENERWGYINQHGRLAVPAEFLSVNDFCEGQALVVKWAASSEQWYTCWIDPSGELIHGVPADYKTRDDFLYPMDRKLAEGLIRIAHGVYATKDLQVEIHLDVPKLGFVCEKSGDFSEGYAAIKMYGWREDFESHWGFIDRSGIFVCEPLWDEVKPFSEGMAAVKKDYKWGFINAPRH